LFGGPWRRGIACSLARLVNSALTAISSPVSYYSFISIKIFFFLTSNIAQGTSNIRPKFEVGPFLPYGLGNHCLPMLPPVLPSRCSYVSLICLNRDTEVIILTAMSAVLALSLTRNFSSYVFENLKFHFLGCILPVNGPNSQLRK
jgi:hypothetical protein